ncbi:hypothetical protein WN944_029081 [Citrus x changshan-huyou]|uniref:Uncharacterized protein n=1 Tax=Citrus x changshan-huyou TaxID=2935761 RepID=A0AAP0Q9J8_9ROSI
MLLKKAANFCLIDPVFSKMLQKLHLHSGGCYQFITLLSWREFKRTSRLNHRLELKPRSFILMSSTLQLMSTSISLCNPSLLPAAACRILDSG